MRQPRGQAWGRRRLRQLIGVAATCAVATFTTGVAAPAQAITCPSVSLSGVVTPAPSASVDWSGCNLSGANLRGANFFLANLTNANFTNAIFYGANVDGANLSGATLTGVSSGAVTGSPTMPLGWRANGGYFFGAGANLDRAVLSGLDLSYYAMDGISAQSAIFAGATMTGASLVGANLKYANFAGADMTATDLTNADASAASFSRTILTSARFTNANLTSDDMWGAYISSLRGFPFQGTDFTGANLAGSNLGGIYMTLAVFFKTNLAGVDFNGSYFGNVNFTSAVWPGADFYGTTWYQTTCPDRTVSFKHNGGSCAQPLDHSAPTIGWYQPSAVFQNSQQINIVWATSDHGGSGVSYSDLRYAKAPAGGGVLSGWIGLATFGNNPIAYLKGALPGYRYCFEARAHDLAGNVGTWSPPKCTSVPLDDRALVASAGWTRAFATGWIGGTYSATTRTGSSLSTGGAVGVFQVGIAATKCPTCGSVAVYVGALKVGVVNLYAATTIDHSVLVLPRLRARMVGVVRLQVLSSGRLVKIDGLAVTGF